MSNYINIPIICFETDKDSVYKYNIVGIIDINNTKMYSTIQYYNINKNYYNDINNALNILNINDMTFNIFMILALHKYFNKLTVSNMNLVENSPNFLLFKYMKQKQLIKQF